MGSNHRPSKFCISQLLHYSLAISILSISIFFPLPLAIAQHDFSPISYFYCHSNFIEKVALYVHGGTLSSSTNGSDQAFYLDLSRNWSVSSPIFIALERKFPSKGVSSVLINNNSEWLMASEKAMYTFTFKNAHWSKPTTYPALNQYNNLPMVIDPGQKQVYIINGYVNESNSENILGVMQYDLASRSMRPMSRSASLGLSEGYTVVWSRVRRVVLIFGGFTNSIPGTISRTLYEFNPLNPNFTALQGINPPSARYGHCMVEAYNGSQIILFGGVDSNDLTLSDLHILDVETLVWTEQKVSMQPMGRAYPCCAVTNDMFVAWSGAQLDVSIHNFNVITQDITIVFNLKTKQWQATFSPDPVVLSSTVPTQTTPTASSTASPSPIPGELSTGAIVGGVFGGLAIVLIVAVILWIRQRGDKKTWTWSSIASRNSSSDNQSLANAAAAPSGNSITHDTMRTKYNLERNENSDDDTSESEYHSTARSSMYTGEFGLGLGKNNFVQNDSSDASIFKVGQIYGSNTTESLPSKESQNQQDIHSITSLTTLRLVPASPTSPSNTDTSSNINIMSIATAFSSSSIIPCQITQSDAQTQSRIPNQQESMAISASTNLSVLSSELEEKWAAAAIALATEGETRVERGERRNPHSSIKKSDYIDSLDLSEFMDLPTPARNPHIILE
ncbi:hypothetical protein FBU30_002681 [Linnemannia zychae]|nr:hypothetical protein FBU30_002681 [Linnemannia zychae]